MLEADGDRCGGGRDLELDGETLAEAICSAEAGSRCEPASCPLAPGRCEESIRRGEGVDAASWTDWRDSRAI